MKKLIVILLFVLPLGLIAQEEPFWDYLYGPNTGYVYNIKVDKDNNIFIGTDNGIYRSIDNGLTWQHLLNFFYSKEIAISENGMIFVTGENSKGFTCLYFSSNKGDNWISLEEPDSLDFIGLSFDQNDDLYFIGSNYSENIITYFSNDYGQTWETQEFNTGLETEFVIWNSNVSKNGEIILGGHYKIDNTYYGIIFLSDDRGKTWDKMTGMPSVKSFLKVDSVTFFAGTKNGLYYSTNRGQSWVSTNFEQYIYDIFLSSSGLYLSTVASVYFSMDFGVTWIRRDSGLNNLPIWNFGEGINGEIYGVNSHGFNITSDSGETWSQKNKSFTAANIEQISFDLKGNIYCAGYGLFKSDDSGLTWESFGLQDKIINRVIVKSTGYIFAGSYWDGYGIFRSTDRGETWENFKFGSHNIVEDFFINKQGHVFIGSEFSVMWKSTDNGETWTKQDLEGSSFCFAINSEGHIFRGARHRSIYRSTDDGDTWEMVLEEKSGPLIGSVTEIVFDPHSTVGFAIQGVWTNDNGRTWKEVDDYIGGRFAVDSLGNFYCFGNDKVYKSSNKGDEWIRIDSGLYHRKFWDIEVSPGGYIFLSAEKGGLYRSKERYVSVDDFNTFNFQLFNYPNPINETTTIEYTTEKAGHVKLSILDILGNEIAVPVDEYQEAGKHSEIVSIGSLPSGVYFYRLESGGRVETGRMVVVR